MKPTITDEIIASLIELSADLAALTEILEYAEPVQNRLSTLIKELEEEKNNGKYKPNAAQGYDYRKPFTY